MSLIYACMSGKMDTFITYLPTEPQHRRLERAVCASRRLVKYGRKHTVLEPIGAAAYAHGVAHLVSIAQECTVSEGGREGMRVSSWV